MDSVDRRVRLVAGAKGSGPKSARMAGQGVRVFCPKPFLHVLVNVTVKVG